jgi:hypothetical protein
MGCVGQTSLAGRQAKGMGQRRETEGCKRKKTVWLGSDVGNLIAKGCWSEATSLCSAPSDRQGSSGDEGP